MLSGEEQERKITTYEEAMNKIKDTTGVSDIKEVVQRFLSQGETQKHLEQLKTNNEKMLVRLKEEKVATISTEIQANKGKIHLWSLGYQCLFVSFFKLLLFFLLGKAKNGVWGNEVFWGSQIVKVRQIYM